MIRPCTQLRQNKKKEDKKIKDLSLYSLKNCTITLPRGVELTFIISQASSLAMHFSSCKAL